MTSSHLPSRKQASEMIMLKLPYPPSVWDMYTGWGRTRRQSSEYKKWLADAAKFVRARNEHPISVPFSVHVCLKRQNGQQDVDNRLKPVVDFLQKAGIIKNDNLCERASIQWDAAIDAECTVLVMAAEPGMAA